MSQSLQIGLVFNTLTSLSVMMAVIQSLFQTRRTGDVRHEVSVATEDTLKTGACWMSLCVERPKQRHPATVLVKTGSGSNCVVNNTVVN